MNTENLCSMEEIHEKEKELKMKLDRGEISQDEYKNGNRKLSNQKRWLGICKKRKSSLNTYKQGNNFQESLHEYIKSLFAKKKKKIIVALLCFAIILGVIIGVIKVYYREVYIELLISIVIYIILLICIIPKIAKKRKQEKELSKLNSIESLVDEDAINFYFDCKRTIESHHGAKFDDIVVLVGAKYGKKDLSSAKEYYYKGESDDFIKEMIVKEQKNEQNRENRIKKYNDELNKINSIRQFKGSNKYLASLILLRENVNKLKGASESLNKISCNNAVYTPKKKDWAIAGGIGSALGGGALGLASAANAQIENQKQEVIASQKREASKDQYKTAIRGLGLAEEIRIFVDSRMSLYKDVLVDSENINDKFNMFRFDEIGITQADNEDGNVIRITVNYSLPETITLLSRKAILDGSLKFSVYNKISGELVFSTYYIAPGYGQYNYKNAGFRSASTISVDIPIFDNKTLNCNSLRCEITPDILWIIEENKEIFKKSNDDIHSIINKYNDEFNKFSREILVSTLN